MAQPCERSSRGSSGEALAIWPGRGAVNALDPTRVSALDASWQGRRLMQGDLMHSRTVGMQWRKTAREVRRAAGRRTWAVELDAATAWHALGGAWRNKG